MKRNKVLIVIDMQNDFVTGALGSDSAKGIIKNVCEKIHDYIDAGNEIFFTRDTHHSDYLDTFEGRHLPIEHCLSGTEGWKIISEIREIVLADGKPRYVVVNKNTFGYYKWGEFIDQNNECDIEIVGVCTDVCVVSNAIILRALFPSRNITVDASCCAGTTMEKHKAALDVMRSCQIEVIGE